MVGVHGEEFVLADIPGLIEGASEGAGLGDRFLGHVERCAVILHLIDGDRGRRRRPLPHHPRRARAYGHGLTEKPEIIGLNKADAVPADELAKKRQKLKRASKRPVLTLSGATGDGVPETLLGAARHHQGGARQSRRGQGRGRGGAVTGSLAAARRLIVKIGSALLVDEVSGDIRRAWLEALVDDIARCRARGQEVLIVSSGAIAVGRRHLGLTGRALKLEEKQAAAATGQIRLAHAYQEALARHGLTVAQILLTPDDTEERRRHLNARATIEQLLALGAVPVINENDTVATAEIRFGDNDRLAARVAQMISADTLVLLSDIDGLYTADPRKDGGAQPYRRNRARSRRRSRPWPAPRPPATAPAAW